MSRPDINDMITAGYSPDELKSMTAPMTVDKSALKTKLAKKGLELLQQTAEKIDNELETKIERQEYFVRHLGPTAIETQIEKLMWAFVLSPDATHSTFFQMNKHVGLAGYVKGLVLQIRNAKKKSDGIERAKILHERRKHKPRENKPDESTLALLDKNAITTQGEFIGWGDPKSSKLNMELVLRQDPRWVGRIRYCTFDGRTHLDNKPVDDGVEAEVGSWVAKVYGFELDDKKIGKLMEMIGRGDPYHPVRDHLDKLTWDGVRRVHELLPKYMESPDFQNDNYITDRYGQVIEYEEFGLEDGANILQLYSIRWMISAVARAYDPGCKVDTVLCLINPKQGSFKSTTCEVLCLDKEEWFDSTSSDLRTKDAFVKIQGKWLIEMQECETLHRSGYNTTKSFLSNRKDRFRSPYDRHAKDVPRTAVFIATTNQNRLGFLNDISGHRRYWVCRVGITKPQELRQVVEQMWAEAVYYYLQGHQYWLTDDEDQIRDRLNDRFREVDSWEEEICLLLLSEYKKKLPGLIYEMELDAVGLDGRKKNTYYLPKKNKETGRLYLKNHVQNVLGFTTKDILREIGIYIKDQKQAELNRCSDIFTRIGVQRGGRKKVGRAYSRFWYLPPAAMLDLVKQYDYQDFVHLVEGPEDESEEERIIRENGAIKDPVIAYVLTDPEIELKDFRGRY